MEVPCCCKVPMPSGFRYSCATPAQLPPSAIEMPVRKPISSPPVVVPEPEPETVPEPVPDPDDVIMELPHTIIKNKSTAKLNISLYITVRDKESGDQAKELLQLLKDLGF